MNSPTIARMRISTRTCRTWISIFIVATLIQRCNGEILPELDMLWIVNKGVEWELVAAAYKLSDIVIKLNKSMEAPGKKKHKMIYRNTGRALRVADALQHALLDTMNQNARCKE